MADFSGSELMSGLKGESESASADLPVIVFNREPGFYEDFTDSPACEWVQGHLRQLFSAVNI